MNSITAYNKSKLRRQQEDDNSASVHGRRRRIFRGEHQGYNNSNNMTTTTSKLFLSSLRRIGRLHLSSFVLLVLGGMVFIFVSVQFSFPPQTETQPTASIKRQPDGIFNGIPVEYIKNDLLSSSSTQIMHSTVHCAGENYGSNAWMFRSCQFRNLCLDVSKKELVLFESSQEKRLQKHLEKMMNLDATTREIVTISSVMSATGMAVSLGSLINHRKQHLEPSSAAAELKWFPVVRDDSILKEDGYYSLPDSYVLVPFHYSTANIVDPGQLVWDSFLPIYTLLSIFGLEKKNLTLLRYELLNPSSKLRSKCDSSTENKEACQGVLSKFLPGMGVPSTNERYSTTRDFRLELTSGAETTKLKSKFVCATYGAAGLGMLSDHGVKSRGWSLNDDQISRNVARGASLWDFRAHMINHLGVKADWTISSRSSQKIVFSLSTPLGAAWDVRKHNIELVRQSLSGENVIVQSHKTAELDLLAQARLMVESSVFVTSCDSNDTVAATFLPRGASLLLYCDGKKAGGSDENNSSTNFDLLSDAAYFRTHWLPFPRRNKEQQSIDDLVTLIRSEVNLIRYQALT